MTKKLVEVPSGVVQEMVKKYDDGNIDVPLASGVNLEELTRGDESPMFVTIDALSDTISNNKRRWTTNELHRIAEQVNSKIPNGYRGHLKAEDRASVDPDAVTLWLGATVAEHKGRNRLFVKGYVLPKAEGFRDYLSRAKAAGKNIAVSVYGQAMEAWNETIKAFEVSNFNLESIDWARPGAEGVPNSGFMKIASEMNGEEEVDKVTVLKSTTVSEMSEHNPTLVQEIQEAAQAEPLQTISEMTTVLGLEDSKDLVKTVSEMKSHAAELEQQVAEAHVDKVLGNKVPNVAARKALRKMVIGEMTSTDLKTVQETVETVIETEEGKALIDAFKTPVVTKGGKDQRDTKSSSRYIKK